MRKKQEFHGVTHGYTRKSTTDGRQQNSHATQRAAITAWAGGRHVEWHQENGSARRGRRRPTLAALLDSLHAGDTLVVARLDRLARSTLDFGQLTERAGKEGWNLVVISPDLDLTTAAGRAFAGVVAVMAQMESELMGERIAEGIVTARAGGRRIGRPRAIPRRVRDRVLAEYDETRSVRAVAAALNDARVPTVKPGGKWWPTTVAKVLRQEGVA